LPYDLRNSSVFSARLNVPSEGSDVIAGGSAFETFAAATGKARSPMVLCNDRGTCSDGDDAARRRHVTRCQRPAVAHCRGNVVLCCSYNGKLERRDGSRSALGRAASGAHEEEETRAHSSLPSTRDGRQNLQRTVVGSVAMKANQPVSSSHSPVASTPVMQPTTGGLV